MNTCCYCRKLVDRAPNAAYCWPCFQGRRPMETEARRQLRKAIRFGILPPASDCYCVDCGGFAEMYDHRDYEKPLEVDPVCRSCNIRRGPAEWKKAA